MTSQTDYNASLPQYTKRSSGGTNLLNEAAALTWLAEAEKDGGIHIAHVFSATRKELTEEQILQAEPTPDAAEAIGRGLAYMHAAGAHWFGEPPTHFEEEGYVINHTVTPVVSDKTSAKKTWGAYFAKERIEPMVAQLSHVGLFDNQDVRLFASLCKKLHAAAFDAPQPALVQEKQDTTRHSALPVTCARLHGDLWAGNVLYDANILNPTKGALIDPMAHGGHAETDLAMLKLFGFANLTYVLGAYNEISSLADGWRERVALHQLAPLLHHCLLFGSSYRAETLSACKRYL